MVFGRVCLIGDAAFTARPHIAVGTAKACEDAWTLTAALDASLRALLPGDKARPRFKPLRGWLTKLF